MCVFIIHINILQTNLCHFIRINAMNIESGFDRSLTEVLQHKFCLQQEEV